MEFRIEGEGSDGSWNYLDPLSLQRPLSWSAAQSQQYIPFNFVMDDIDGDVFREGLGGPFSRFRVRATLVAGAGASVGFSFMSLRIEQLNK